MSNCLFTFKDPLTGEQKENLSAPEFKAYLFKGGLEALLGNEKAAALLGDVKNVSKKTAIASAIADKVEEQGLPRDKLVVGTVGFEQSQKTDVLEVTPLEAKIATAEKMLESGVNPQGKKLTSKEKSALREMIQDWKDEAKSNQESPKTTLINTIAERLKKGGLLTAKTLTDLANEAFGGTSAEGKYTFKDAYDLMEAAVNKALAEQYAPTVLSKNAHDASYVVRALNSLVSKLPTQTKRDAEMDRMQQFSTPPALSYVANWVADVADNDTMLEPSAGTGDLAIWSKIAGAKVVLNELSERRADILKTIFPDAELFTENAEQLNNILPKEVKPTVIVMNPPFSVSVGVRSSNNTMNGAKHIEQALLRLQPNGRLVAIVGNGMAADKPAFKAWWKEIQSKYNVRANIGISGKEYAKYGTTFDNQILVIDKTGATTQPVLIGQVEKVADLLPLLEGIKNERPTIKSTSVEQTGNQTAETSESTVSRSNTTRGTGTSAVGNQSGNSNINNAEQGNGRNGTSRTIVQSDTRANDAVTDRIGQSGRDKAGISERAEGISVDANRPDNQSNLIEIESTINESVNEDLTDSVFANYSPQKLAIKGAKPHPSKLVQSAAMASVEPPNPTYQPSLPKEVVEDGLLSLAQLESVVYAGQAHSQVMPDGRRRGFFIGDGTGVGKGREISGIILDNLMQGRDKALWVSFSEGLIEDAKRDFSGVGGNENLIFWQGKTKTADSIKNKNGILFTSYGTLSSGAKQEANDSGQKKGQSRLEQIVEWLGKDFDGVIAFDESHSMGNAVSSKGKRGRTKPSKRAITGLNLQKMLPNARIVYVSATGATELNNLAYADRLGLWGEGTAFSSVEQFIEQVSQGGIAAMELISRDIKAMGGYLARSLSFDGVTYQRLDHDLSDLDTDIYNELARAWQVVLQNIDKALSVTEGDKNSDAKGAALSAFWGAHQRFFNQIITAMQTPTVIADIEKQLKDGNAAVIQLVNTNEATQERQAKQAAENETPLEELDFTPRQLLFDYVSRSFPVQQYHEEEDDNGNKILVPTFDSKGNPVFNQEAIELRDQLLENLQQIRVPDNPIDMIINHFGSDMVAEVTGRGRRFVRVQDDDNNFKLKEEKRGKNSSQADAKAFQDDKKKILIFSQAGGTGFSFHADNTAKNKRTRIHYILQPGWRADSAVQGFGRTHRTNQAQPPVYILPTTNLKAQKRFVSSVARRLDQLGALTRGQRQASSQGLFTAADNLESKYSEEALYILFTQLYRNQVVGLNFHDLAREMGLNLIDKDTGALVDSKIPSIQQFLNRLLSLSVTMQDKVFDAFEERLIDAVNHAKANNRFDEGVQTLRAKSIVKTDDQVIYTDQRTGAQTRMVELDVTVPVENTSWNKAKEFSSLLEDNKEFGGWYLGLHGKMKDKVFLLKDRKKLLNSEGKEVHRGTMYAVESTNYIDNADEVMRGYIYGTVNGKYQQIPITKRLTEKEAKELWQAQYEAAPTERTDKKNILVGAILPIWDRINSDSYTIYRLQTDNGEQLLGRVLSTKEANQTLKNFGVGSKASRMPVEQQFASLKAGNTLVLANGWKIEPVKVNNEQRLEIKTERYLPQATQDILINQGVTMERIQWEQRLFIPNSKEGFDTFKRIAESKPVVDIIGDKPVAQQSFDLDPEDVEESYDEDLLALFQPKPETPSKFKQWFRNSWFTQNNVNNKNAPAEPAKFYHATNADDLTFFDKSKLGSNTKTQPTSGLGFFFSKNKADTARYGKTVLEVHLSAQNPLVTNSYDLPMFNSIEQAKQYSQALQDKGYDGIYLKDAGYAIVFKSNQAKLTSNTEPTDSDDIRFSKRVGDDKTLDIFSDLSEEWNDLDRAYFDALERGDMEAAQRMVVEAAEKSGLPVIDETDVTAYKVRRTAPPKKTQKAYKLFRVKKSQKGEVFALFVGNKDPLPQGVWLDAISGTQVEIKDKDTGEVTIKVESSLGNLAYRPGWHAGDIPLATHIGAMDMQGNIIARKYDEVWAEVEMADDMGDTYQEEALKNGITEDGNFVQAYADIKYMPENGLYRYKTNPNMTGQWIISGSMKINRVLSEDEVNQILQDNNAKIMPWAEETKPSKQQKQEIANAQLVYKAKMDKYQDELLSIKEEIKSLSLSAYKDKIKEIKSTQGKDAAKDFENELRAKKLKKIQDKKAIEQKIEDETIRTWKIWSIKPLELSAWGLNADPAKNQKKLLDVKTYDNNGNIIPLSQRFNANIQDPRYSKTKAEKPHTSKQSFLSAFTKQLDKQFGQGWSNLLMATGKVKFVSSEEADRVISGVELFHRAWHGTPHNFDKFELSKIGTGEGAQAYGYGLYFAGAKEIAEWYKSKLSDYAEVFINGVKREETSEPNLEAYRESIDRLYRGQLQMAEMRKNPENKAAMLEMADKSKSILDAIDNGKVEFRSKGKLYEVELAPAEDEYLLWDKPLSEQSETVKNAIREANRKDMRKVFKNTNLGSNMWNDDGNNFYHNMMPAFSSEKELSNYLHSIGIRGIKYLDGSSRGKGGDNYNYVIFDDNDIQIVAKYSKNGKVQAFYNPKDDTTYFVYDNIEQSKDLTALAAHELGVHALQMGKDDKEFNAILSEVEDMVNAKNPSKEIKAAVARAKAANTKPKHFNEEVLAYLVEFHPNLSVVQKFLAWFKKKLRAIGKALPMAQRLEWFKRVTQLNETDLVYMAHSALRNAPSDLLFDEPTRKTGIRESYAGQKANNSDLSEEQRQYKEVEARYFNEDGTPKEGAMLAPNGQPTNLNKHQWIQVRTPNFIKWFGDWENDPENASKVVDENGEPLVVYHGTGKGDFYEFSIGKSKNKRVGMAEKNTQNSFWFAENEFVAKKYASKETGGFFNPNSGAKIYSVFINAKNPRIIDMLKESLTPEEKSYLYDAPLLPKGTIRNKSTEIAFRKESEITKALQNNNDGVIFKNGYDGEAYYGEIIAVFNPNQIKSATANTGAFNPENDDIRYSIASTVTDFFTGEETRATTIDDIDTMLQTGRQPRRDTGLQYWKDKIVTAFADSTRPFQRFISDYLPDHASDILSGADRATGMKAAFEREAMNLFGRDIGKAIRAIKKANPKFDYKTAKDLAGTWLSARYAPVLNDWLMEQDQQAVNDLIAQGASQAKINKAKAEQAKRIAAINDTSIISPIAQPKDSGLAGGYNNATAERIKDMIESEIDVSLLEELADHVYNMNEWTLRQDIRNGKISPAMAAALPNSRFYVPLAGDPRADKNMALIQNGIDASFEELQKSATYHGWKDFKDAIQNAYEDLIQAKLDEGKTQDEAEREVWEENQIKRRSKGGLPEGDNDIVINGMIYTINSDEAMQALRNANNEDVPSILKPIAYLTRLQARLVTQFMPLFAPTNMIRDVAERSENIRTRKIEGFNGDMNQVANDSIKNAARLLMRIKPVMMGVLAENTPMAKLFPVDNANSDVQDLKQFLALGGSSTYGDILSNDSKKLSDKLKATGTIPDNVMEAIYLYNNAFEMISGFSIYQSLIKQGLDERKAATASLNLMNFRKRGKYMNPIRALYMFAQPIATGGHQLAKTLTTKRGLARFAAYTVAAALLYSLLRSGDDDDDLGINKMDEQGNFTLYRNILIPMGDGQYFKMPVGFGMQQLAWSHGVNFVRMAAGSMTPSETAAESIALWTKAAAPIAPAETAILRHPAVWVAQTFSPQIAKPIVNIGLDVNAFSAPLTNARYGKEDKAKALQGRRDTPEFYKMAVEELAKATGGQVDMYPEQLRELLRGYGAGVGNEMLKWAIENPAKEQRGLKVVSPVIDRYVLQSNDDSLKQRLYFRLRDRMNELNALESTGARLTPEEKRLADLGDILKKREAQQRAKLSAATKAERSGNLKKAETLRALADRMRVSYIDYGLMQSR